MHLWSSEFPDKTSQMLFILSYMKGRSAGAWAMQKTSQILHTGEMPPTFMEFKEELDLMFVDPSQEATAQQKLTFL